MLAGAYDLCRARLYLPCFSGAGSTNVVGVPPAEMTVPEPGLPVEIEPLYRATAGAPGNVYIVNAHMCVRQGRG